MTEKDKETALYYPYIDITDASFIKTAALYWDEIQTIVPEQIETPYRTAESIEAKKQGFLKPLTIEERPGEIAKAGEEIVEDVDNINWDTFPDQGKVTRLYKHKISDEAIYNLESKLKKKFKYVSPNLIALPENIGNVYMSRLASVIADTDGNMPITNVTGGHDILSSRFINYTQECVENQARLANMSLQVLTINPDVPLVDIIRFRNDNREKLLAYRREISKLTDGISKGLDTGEKQALFERKVKNEIIPAIENIENELKRKENVFMVVNTATSIVSMICIIASGGQAWFNSFIKTGLALGINFCGNISRTRTIQNKPIGYLYGAQEQFGANKNC